MVVLVVHRLLGAYGRGTAVPVSGFSNAGALAEELYRVRLPDRDVEGLLVADSPDGEMPLGFVTCGQQCADVLMAFGRARTLTVLITREVRMMTKTWFRLGVGFLLACLASLLVWLVQTAFGTGPEIGYGKIVAGAAVLVVFYRGWRHMVESVGGDRVL